MLLTSGLLTGLVAIGAASPTRQTFKHTSSNVTLKATPTHADGNWHIGCSKENKCSYYQRAATPTGLSQGFVTRNASATPSTCFDCGTNTKICESCAPAPPGSKQFLCYDTIMHQAFCVAIKSQRNAAQAGASSQTIGTAVTLFSHVRQEPEHEGDQVDPSSDNETYHEPEEHHEQEEEAPEEEEHVQEHSEEPEQIEHHPEQPEYKEPEQSPAIPEHEAPQHAPSSTVEHKPEKPTSTEPSKTYHQPTSTNTSKHGKPTHEAPTHEAPTHEAPAHGAPTHSVPTATSKTEEPKHGAPTHSGKPDEYTAPKHHSPVYDFPVSENDTPYLEFAEEECQVCVEGEPCHLQCHWQFKCGEKKKCFHNGAREIIELCYEKGKLC